MLDLYTGGKGDVDWCADAVEGSTSVMKGVKMPSGPVVGVNVQVCPSCSVYGGPGLMV
jgi:hypothetical protein